MWRPFSMKILIKHFCSSLKYYSKHIEYACWRKLLDALLMVRVNAWYSIDMYVCIDIFAVQFEFIFLVNGVININIQKNLKIYFPLCSMVYWIAGPFLFRTSWKVFPWCFDELWVWLLSAYRLNVFGCLCTVRALAIALRSWCCEYLSDNATISDKPMVLAFPNNLILFSWRKHDLLSRVPLISVYLWLLIFCASF